MTRIGILAYGSLIDEPGDEISPLIVERQSTVETPFKIEFARSSSSRNGAPTVIPVDEGGSFVQATILVLHPDVSLQCAENLLWRRETRNENTSKHYSRPVGEHSNRVIVEKLCNFNGNDFVIYTKIGANITDPSPTNLAHLAIKSAEEKAGKEGKDGISYLISLKCNGISTPIMPQYVNEILRLTETCSLEDALKKCLK